ncbi:MAG TPA: glycosyltransferase family 2 protein [Thermoanaerobaculia bacterium]|nr:glycosyltransferase family 2 protein [Thermoanaerobaculia bacterium]
MSATIFPRSTLGVHVAAVVPAYNVAEAITAVLRQIPPLVRTIVVVDDASTDGTAAVADRCAEIDQRVLVVHHDQNRGVGGAMITGFRTAIDAGADVVVKIDGDGQMPLWLLPQLVTPLIAGEADYTKGNRFRDFNAVRQMPLVRRIGNVLLSFLAKSATGYWHCFDPTNGFVAIRADVLSQVPLSKIDPSYFFEMSMLANLYLLGAVVKEVPMPARYAGEPSSLRIGRVMRQFPAKLIAALVRRVALRNFVYDFNLESLHLAAGVPLLLGGVIYGAYNWIWYVRHHLAAPTGTVALAAIAIILGVQLLITAASYDLQSVPREPVNRGPLSDALLDERPRGRGEALPRESEAPLV